MRMNKTTAWQIAAALGLLAPGILWFWHDQHVWEWDQARYAHMAFDLWQYQFSDTALWRWTLFHHLPTKAPGVSWMGQFFCYLIPVVGSVNRALMLQMATCSLLASVLLAKTVRLLYPGKPLWSWWALVACLSSPLFLNLNQEYMTEPMQMLGICWFLWAVVSQKTKAPARVLAEILASTAFLMISKGVSPLYVWGFGLWFLVAFLPRLAGKRREAFGWTPARVLAVGCAAFFFLAVLLWYVFNGAMVFGYVASASSGSVALAYGKKTPWLEKNGLWIRLLGHAYASPLLALALGVALAASLFFAWRGRAGFKSLGVRFPGSAGLVLAAAAQILLVWWIVTKSPTEEWRPLMGLLPSFVLILVASLSRIPSRMAPLLLLAVGLAQSASFHAKAFGYRMPAGLDSGQPLRIRDLAGEQKAELGRVIRTTCALCPRMEDAMMCAVSIPWLNANTLRYYAATEFTDTPRYGYYGSTGFMTSQLDHLIANFRKQDPCVVITMTPEAQAAYHSVSPASLPFFGFLEGGGEYQAVPFASSFGVRIFLKASQEAPPPPSAAETDDG